MFTFVLTLHFLLCGSLVCLVLMQQGKGADMGAAFGAGSSNSLFGAGGANSLVVKITTFVAVAFMITSIVLINLTNSADAAAVSAIPVNGQDLTGSVMEQVVEAKDPAASNAITTATAAAPIAQTSVAQPAETQVPNQPTLSAGTTASEAKK